ncbi:MAG TPA: RHS repeat-associated core domain-containing protein [Candidatus Acidoferrales bacterium]|nr:RHS repeat-associated core domain-containing protein [Candidatus Acidoferrales bacterium]
MGESIDADTNFRNVQFLERELQCVEPAHYFRVSFDAAGNMTHDASHSYTYDAENRITQVDGGSTASYIYDAEGRRVQKTAAGVTTNYVYDLAGHVMAEYGCNTCWNVGYIYLNDALKGIYTNNTTYFVHPDHLGSTRLLTGYPTPSIVECDDYYPFGELTSCGGSSISTHEFTGKERDSESNLDNFGARYNSSQMGRFMSPDPGNAGADPANPQSWNMYSYVMNNPLTLTDPTGMFYNPGVGDGGDDGGLCDPFYGCGIGIGIGMGMCGGHNCDDRQPPIYTPPATQNKTDPDPSAGDPDPDGPFSGPIWQEGGPQIPTGNLAVLLGVPNPSPFIIDNWTTDAYGNVVGDYNGEQLCGPYSSCIYWYSAVGLWGSASPQPRIGATPTSPTTVPQSFGQFASSWPVSSVTISSEQERAPTIELN